jgi:hypothetical protein
MARLERIVNGPSLKKSMQGMHIMLPSFPQDNLYTGEEVGAHRCMSFTFRLPSNRRPTLEKLRAAGRGSVDLFLLAVKSVRGSCSGFKPLAYPVSLANCERIGAIPTSWDDGRRWRSASLNRI